MAKHKERPDPRTANDFVFDTDDSVKLADVLKGDLGDTTNEPAAIEGIDEGCVPSKLWACKVEGCPERIEAAETEDAARAKYRDHQQIVSTVHKIYVQPIPSDME